MIKLIVGLGNPGDKYAKTRHNIGFEIVDRLAAEPWKKEDKFSAEVSQVTIGDVKHTLLKPHTFMNNSGQAVASYARYFNILPEEIVLIYDEFAIPLGKIRVRVGGGNGGHNGVKSVTESLNSDQFVRVRTGIGSETKTPLEDFVLSSFHPSEQRTVDEMIGKGVETVKLILTEGIDLYLSKHHEG
jgi:PTH1 family peptidyl-tRNA hydrolase